PAAALTDQLACQHERSETDLRRLALRMKPTMRSLLERAASQLPPHGEANDAIDRVLADDNRLEAGTVTFIDFVGAEVCKHYRVFASRVVREAELRDWMLHELAASGGGRLWSFLEYAQTGRRYGVLVIVDGLQGHLVEALAHGEAADPFVQAIAREQRAGVGVPSPP